MGNEVRIKASVTGNAKQEIGGIRDAWAKFQKEGGQGVKAGLTAAAAAKGFSILDSAISGVTGKIGEATEAASNLQQSAGAVESVFGPAADTIEDFGETADQSLGLSKRAVNELAAVSGAQLKSFGFDVNEAAAETKKLQQRAADLAATFGGPTDEALRAISALMRGERDPIERYGVSLKQADVDARVMAKGLDTSTVAAKKHSDAIAALELFYEQTADAQGQFARESESAAGSQARAQAKYENQLARLGERLLPIVAEGASVAADSLENLANVLDLLGGKLPETEEGMDNLIGFFNGLSLNPLVIMWQNSMGMVEDKTAEATEKATASLRYMADAAKDDFVQIDLSSIPMRHALERIGMTAEEAAEAADKAMKDIVDSVDRAASDLEAAASEAADSLYDPLIDKAKLAQLERDMAEERHKRNAAKIHSEEFEEAQDHLNALEKEHLETLASLAAAGDKEAKARILAFVAAKKASGTLSAQQIGDLNNLIAKINAAESEFRQLARLNFMASKSKDDTYIPGRAGGGPVEKGQPYWVGEAGRKELFVPNQSGQIIANPGRMGSAGGGWGGITFAPTIVIQGVATPAVMAQIQNELGPVMLDYFRRQGALA